MSTFNDKHRAIIQAFMCRKTLKMDDMKELFATIFAVNNPDPIDPRTFPENEIQIYLFDINEELSRFDLEIKSIHSQDDRTPIYALVNLSSDTVIQSATHHTADEIAYFRRLLDAMFDTNNQANAEVFAVKRNDAEKLHKAPRGEEEENEGGGGKGLTMYEAQQALQSFVEEGWLERSENQWYSLAPRGLLELSEYLKKTYNSSETAGSPTSSPAPGEDLIRFCYLCKDMLTVGQRCDDFSCPVRMHNPCAKVLFEKPDPKCPGCKKVWSGDSPVGEKAAARLHFVRRQGGKASAVGMGGKLPKADRVKERRKLTRVVDDDEEDEEEEEEDDEARESNEE